MKTKNKTNHVLRKVKEALHEEKEAIRDYRKDAKKVDPKTAKTFRSIAKDETEHKQRLIKAEKRLNRRCR